MLKWTKETIIQTIQQAAVDGMCSSVVVGPTVTAMARRKFGSFVDACAAAGVTAKSARPTAKVCSVDGCDNAPRSTYAENCEKHYYRMRRTGQLLRADGHSDKVKYDECAHCGTPTSGSRHCSARCATRDSRGNPVTKECASCGDEFTPTNKGKDSVTCSEECARHRTISIQGIHRARANGLEYEYINRLEVFIRDDWTCQICGEAIDKDAVWPAPYAATIDHIVPVAKKGAHLYSNVQSAHTTCNNKKHTTVGYSNALL